MIWLSSNRFRESSPPPFFTLGYQKQRDRPYLLVLFSCPCPCPCQITKKLTVVEGLKVVGEGQNVGVSDRDATENCDFVADHMFLALHQLLVDDLDGIALSRLNLYLIEPKQETVSACPTTG